MKIKLLPINYPFQCRNKVCGGYCSIEDVECPDKWVFPENCPLEDAQ